MQRSAHKLFFASDIYRVLAMALVGTALGCGKGESTESTASEESQARPVVASATPAEAVNEFMMAFKNGDEAKAAELVTEKTRQEMERTQYGVSPPGTKDLEFKVGDVEYVAENKELAHVACHISDLNELGEKWETDLVWFLRKEARGWRVAGMAMKVFPDQLPVLLNFEDMDEMEQKVKMVRAEEARREQAKFEEAKATLLQAQQPPEATVRQE